MNYKEIKEAKDNMLRYIVKVAEDSNDVRLKMDVYRFLDEVTADVPNYTGVIDKFKEMKKAEDGTKVVVKSDLRRLNDGVL